MNADLESQLVERLDAMSDGEWVAFMAYFARRMLDEQRLLIELICRRAEQRAATFNKERVTEQHLPADEMDPLLRTCGLKLALIGPVVPEVL